MGLGVGLCEGVGRGWGWGAYGGVGGLCGVFETGLAWWGCDVCVCNGALFLIVEYLG